MLLSPFRRWWTVAAAREDALVIGEAVARQGRQPFRIAIAGWMRCLLHLTRFAILVGGQVAFQIDHFAHDGIHRKCEAVTLTGIAAWRHGGQSEPLRLLWRRN